MNKPPQKRRLETQTKLLAAAQVLIDQNEYDSLRVEHVVAEAGVAKGTFFSHFADKDVLLSIIIGGRMHNIWETAKSTSPKSSHDICEALVPMMEFWGSERVVFDVAVRYSGIAGDTPTEIAENFIDQIKTATEWIMPLQGSVFRDDQDPVLLAEGLQAFVTQVVALHHCCAPTDVPWVDRLFPFVSAWLDAR